MYKGLRLLLPSRLSCTLLCFPQGSLTVLKFEGFLLLLPSRHSWVCHVLFYTLLCLLPGSLTVHRFEDCEWNWQKTKKSGEEDIADPGKPGMKWWQKTFELGLPCPLLHSSLSSDSGKPGITEALQTCWLSVNLAEDREEWRRGYGWPRKGLLLLPSKLSLVCHVLFSTLPCLLPG